MSSLDLLNSHINDSQKIYTSILVNGVIPSYFPPQLHIDLTNRCNYKCSYCTFGNVTVNNHSNQPCQDIEKLYFLVKNFSDNGGQSIFLTGGGEPGTYPDLEVFLEFLSQLPLRLSFNTNGYMLKRILNMLPTKSDLFQNLWCYEKSSIISVSLHNKDAFDIIRKMRNAVDTYGFHLKIRGTSLINKSTTPMDLESEIMTCAKAGAHVISFKPMHSPELTAKNMKRAHLPNQNIYDYLNNTKFSTTPIEVLPVRIDRIRSDFIKNVECHNEDTLCLASLSRCIVNALGERSICCTAKLPVTGIGDRYFTCGYGIDASVLSYYLDVLYGAIDFQHEYCVHGCGYMENNLSWNTIEMPYINILRRLRSIHRKEQLNKQEIITELKYLFEYDKYQKNRVKVKNDLKQPECQTDTILQ